MPPCEWPSSNDMRSTLSAIDDPEEAHLQHLLARNFCQDRQFHYWRLQPKLDKMIRFDAWDQSEVEYMLGVDTKNSVMEAEAHSAFEMDAFIKNLLVR